MICTIAHIQYIKIITSFRGFQVIFLYLVWFSLCSSLFWGLRDNGVMENLQKSEPCQNFIISTVGFSFWYNIYTKTVDGVFTYSDWQIKSPDQIIKTKNGQSQNSQVKRRQSGRNKPLKTNFTGVSSSPLFFHFFPSPLNFRTTLHSPLSQRLKPGWNKLFRRVHPLAENLTVGLQKLWLVSVIL